MSNIYEMSFNNQAKQISNDYANNILLLANQGLYPRKITYNISGANKEWTTKNQSNISKIAAEKTKVKYPNLVMFNRVMKVVKGIGIKKDIEIAFNEARIKTKFIINEFMINGYSHHEIMREIAEEENKQWRTNHVQTIIKFAKGETNRVAFIYANRLETFIKHQRRNNPSWKKNLQLVIAGSARSNKANLARDLGKV